MPKYELILAEAMLSSGATKLQPFKPFTWTSGAIMPVYNDNRTLLSSFANRRTVAQAFGEVLKTHKIECDVVAGTATAGIAPATTLADYLELPLVYVRSSAKEHGLQRRIEGVVTQGQRVVLIEDLVSTGGSAISAIEALRQAGAEVVLCLAIFSYGFPKSVELFKNSGVECKALLTFDTLRKFAQDNGYISPDQNKLLNDWAQAPFEWAKKHGFDKADETKP